MTGDERVRFCQACKLSVYNLAEMTRAEAEELLKPKDGGKLPCVQLWRRRDGTIITKDCPVGWRDRVEQMCARAGALASMIFAFMLSSAGAQELQAVKGKVAAGEQSVETNSAFVRGRAAPMKGEPVAYPIAGQMIAKPPESVELNVSSSLVSRRGTWQEKHKAGTKLATDNIKPNRIDAGKIEQARRNLIAQAERAEELNFKQEAAISFNNAGNCAFYLGKTDDARRLYERALMVSCSSCNKEDNSALSSNTESVISNLLLVESRGAKKTDLKKLDPRVVVLYEQLKAAQAARLVWIHTVNGGLTYSLAKLPAQSSKH